MCLFHDMAEARSGDQNYIHKRYVKVDEDQILQDQLSAFPEGSKLSELVWEYQERETDEAKLAKDADLIAQFILLKEYGQMGHEEASRWMIDNEHIKRINSEEAKKLYVALIEQNPSDWWKGISTHENK